LGSIQQAGSSCKGSAIRALIKRKNVVHPIFFKPVLPQLFDDFTGFDSILTFSFFLIPNLRGPFPARGSVQSAIWF
jgi:hypothetical protein